MDSKVCVVCKIEKSIDNFYNKYRNVNSVILKEVQDVTTKTKTNYQINDNCIMEKIEVSYLQRLK